MICLDKGDLAPIKSHACRIGSSYMDWFCVLLAGGVHRRSPTCCYHTNSNLHFVERLRVKSSCKMLKFSQMPSPSRCGHLMLLKASSLQSICHSVNTGFLTLQFPHPRAMRGLPQRFCVGRKGTTPGFTARRCAVHQLFIFPIKLLELRLKPLRHMLKEG